MAPSGVVGEGGRRKRERSGDASSRSKDASAAMAVEAVVMVG